MIVKVILFVIEISSSKILMEAIAYLPLVVNVHESSEGLSSITIPKARAIPPSACLGTPQPVNIANGRALKVPSLEN